MVTTRWGSLRSTVRAIASALVCLAVGAHAATFTVSNTDDGGTGSLRWAILSANSAPGPDTIAFSIPPFDGTVKSIVPTTVLPVITGPVTIDGYTQTGSSPNTLSFDQGDDAVLLIEVAGTNLAAPAGGVAASPGARSGRV